MKVSSEMEDFKNSIMAKVTYVGLALFVFIVILINVAPMMDESQREQTSPQKEFAQYSEELVLKAEQGDAAAQYSLGNCYFYGFGVDKDQREAVKWLRKSAEQGYALAMNDLGHCYYSGAGVERDQEEAERWWKKAAEKHK